MSTPARSRPAVAAPVDGGAVSSAAGWNGLRLMLVGPLPPPAGGMANQTRQLAELLHHAGATVELVQTNAPCRPAWISRVKGLRALGRLLPFVLRLFVVARRSQVVHVMANSGWSWHLYAAPALAVARLCGRPVVVNYRGGGAGPFLARSQRSVRFSLRWASALVVPSGFLQQVFAGVNMTASIVPNIVDLARFRPLSPAAEFADAQAPHLIVARNLEALYDNATALRAFARVRIQFPGARLTIAGTGPELTMLQALTAELGLGDCVAFVGRLNRDEMADLYRQASVMLNPSLTDNTPNSVLEAWASGVPVVSTNVGGVPFLVTDGADGLLVPPRQPEAMGVAALRVLREPGLRDQLKQQGLAQAQRYTWDQVAPQLLALYRVTLSGPQSQPV